MIDVNNEYMSNAAAIPSVRAMVSRRQRDLNDEISSFYDSLTPMKQKQNMKQYYSSVSKYDVDRNSIDAKQAWFDMQDSRQENAKAKKDFLEYNIVTERELALAGKQRRTKSFIDAKTAWQTKKRNNARSFSTIPRFSDGGHVFEYHQVNERSALNFNVDEHSKQRKQSERIHRFHLEQQIGENSRKRAADHLTELTSTHRNTLWGVE